MFPLPPISTLTDTLVPYTTRFRSAAQTGDVETALGHLKSSTIETSGDSALTAAEQWLQLAPLERERTAIYASGRALRTAVNEAVQRELKRSEEHTSELQSLLRISYAVICLKKTNTHHQFNRV